MKKGIIGFFVIVLCLGMLAGCGKNAATAAAAPSNAPDAQALSSSHEGASVPASAFSDEDLQMLQALQFDDYRHMTIAEFQNKVWEKTDTQEYGELLSRLSKAETLYALRDSDETAAFVYYVLEPLTKENWQSHTYGGAASSDFPAGQDNARLEYTYDPISPFNSRQRFISPCRLKFCLLLLSRTRKGVKNLFCKNFLPMLGIVIAKPERTFPI